MWGKRSGAADLTTPDPAGTTHPAFRSPGSATLDGGRHLVELGPDHRQGRLAGLRECPSLLGLLELVDLLPEFLRLRFRPELLLEVLLMAGPLPFVLLLLLFLGLARGLRPVHG